MAIQNQDESVYNYQDDVKVTTTNQNNQEFENESNKSDTSDTDKMNTFGFNDDLGPLLDDRIII
jgi:hypothetical protein